MTLVKRIKKTLAENLSRDRCTWRLSKTFYDIIRFLTRESGALSLGARIIKYLAINFSLNRYYSNRFLSQCAKECRSRATKKCSSATLLPVKSKSEAIGVNIEIIRCCYLSSWDSWSHSAALENCREPHKRHTVCSCSPSNTHSRYRSSIEKCIHIHRFTVTVFPRALNSHTSEKRGRKILFVGFFTFDIQVWRWWPQRTQRKTVNTEAALMLTISLSEPRARGFDG